MEDDIPERKPKQRRKFTWTPARRAAFEKCRKARAEALATKKPAAKQAQAKAKSQRDTDDLEIAREQARRVMEAIRRHDSSESAATTPPPTITEVKKELKEADPSLTESQLTQLLQRIDKLQASLDTKPAKPKKAKAKPRQKAPPKPKKRQHNADFEESGSEADLGADVDFDDNDDMYEDEPEVPPVRRKKQKSRNSFEQEQYTRDSSYHEAPMPQPPRFRFL